jgi:F-type H+-transporting ATPase subunit gamma
MDKDLQHRIKSIQQTVQISGAQKLVAASQIGKARRLLNESKPYHDRVTRAVADMLDQCPETASKYIGFLPANASRRGLIVLSASRGLTGGFNSNIIHTTEKYLNDNSISYIIALGWGKYQIKGRALNIMI